MKILKNKLALAALALFGVVGSAFAEGESGSSSVDTSQITEKVTDMGNALLEGVKATVAAVTPIAINILIAAMVLGMIVVGIRWLYRIVKTSSK